MMQHSQSSPTASADEPHLNNLPLAARRRVTALVAVQEKHRKLECEQRKEMLALEKKYLKLYQPFFVRRSKIVSGAEEPTEEEVTAGTKVQEEHRRAAQEAGEETTAAKVTELKEGDGPEGDGDVETGIPEFWLTAIKNHMRIAELVTDRDQVPLQALTDIELAYLPDETPGYRLTFKFAENDVFTNRELVKTYYYKPELDDTDLLYDRAEGTKIDWKPGMDLTVAVEAKRQRHKVTNQVRMVKKTVPADTFFDFFDPPLAPAEGSDEEKAMTSEEREELSSRLELDYELGEEFKDKIIPNAIDWFTGKALDYEDFEPEFGEGNEFYDDDEEEDDDDDDEDDEDDEDDDAHSQGRQAT